MTAAALAAAVIAAVPQASAAPKGANCAKPWKVSYVKGKVRGDVRKVQLTVKVAKSKSGTSYTISWGARKGTRFCSLRMVEKLGQVFTSHNPKGSYTYVDRTPGRKNGIRSLTAGAKTAP